MADRGQQAPGRSSPVVVLGFGETGKRPNRDPRFWLRRGWGDAGAHGPGTRPSSAVPTRDLAVPHGEVGTDELPKWFCFGHVSPGAGSERSGLIALKAASF